MKSKLILSLIILSLVLCACSSQETPVVSEFPRIQAPALAESAVNPSESPEIITPSDTADEADNDEYSIIVSAYGYMSKESSSAYLMAQLYMSLTPGVNVEVYYTQLQNLAIGRKYLREIKADNNSGAGPDVVFFDSNIPFKDLEMEIKLADLTEQMESDPSYFSGEYFEGVVSAVRTNGGQYFFPLSFNFEYVMLNKQFETLLDRPFEANESINYKQMMDIYDKAAVSEIAKDNLYMFDGSNSFSGFGRVVDINGADIAGSKSNINTPEKAELVKRWMNISFIPSELFNRAVKAGSFSEVGATPLFGTSSFAGTDISAAFMPHKESDYTEAVLFSDFDGSIPFMYNEAMALNEESEKKELAWDFMRFCMDTLPAGRAEIGAIIGFGSYGITRSLRYPINKQLFNDYMKSKFETSYSDGNMSGLIYEDGYAETVMNALSSAVRMAESCNRLDLTKMVGFPNIGSSEIFFYRDGRQTFEETMRNIEKICDYALSEL